MSGACRPQGIHAQTLRLLGGVFYDVVPELVLGLALDARTLIADDGGAQGSNAVTGGAIATVRYSLPAGPLRLTAGPEAEVLARPILVEVDGAEVFRVPTFVLGFVVEANLDLGRPD